MEEDLLMYIVVNKEVEMSKGKMGAQTAHAATIMLMSDGNASDPTVLRWYHQCEQKKIVLRAKESQLLTLIEQGAYEVRDNGHTEVPPNTLTCVGFKPATKDDMKHLIGRLQIFKD